MLANSSTESVHEHSMDITLLGQRVSRLVRDALSFSKKLANHIGAINCLLVTTT